MYKEKISIDLSYPRVLGNLLAPPLKKQNSKGGGGVNRYFEFFRKLKQGRKYSVMFISTRNTPNITILQRIYYEYYDEKYLHHSIPPNFRAPIISTHPLSLSPLWSILHIPKFGRKIQFRLINSPCMSLSLSLSVYSRDLDRELTTSRL